MGNAKKPRKIAVWGYDWDGKRLVRIIQKYWTVEYLITLIFDPNMEPDDVRALKSGPVIISASKVAAANLLGEFEAVIVAESYQPTRERIIEQLEGMGIPVITLVSPDQFQPFESFEDAESRDLPHRFTLHTYRNLYGYYAPLYEWHTAFFLFDEQGRMLRDTWFLNYLASDPCVCNNAVYPPKPGILKTEHLAGSYCLVFHMWATNYGHFTYQTLDQIMLMEQDGFTGKYLVVRTGYSDELLALAGIDAERIVWVNEFEKDTLYQFEEIHIIAQRQYDFRKSAPLMIDAAERILKTVDESAGERESYPSRLYVKRVGVRKLLAVESLLGRFGFETMVPEGHSVAEQVRYFRNADIVVTPHGANSTNVLYMRPGTVMIEVFSKKWAVPWCTELVHAKNVHYFPLVEMPILGTVKNDVDADYRVNNTMLEMLLKSAIKIVGQEDQQ